MPVVTHRERPLFDNGYEINGDTTVYSNDFMFPDLPNEIGRYSLFIDIQDNGSEVLPTIKSYLQYIFDPDRDIYGELHEIYDDSGSSAITAGVKFEARLDTQDFWKFAIGFRIAITTTGGTSPKIKINYAGIHAR